MDSRSVYERVHRVQPKSIEVVIAKPHQGVVAKKATHFVTTCSVEIHGRSPGCRVVVIEIRAEPPEVIAYRAQVVVNNIQQNSQTLAMTRIDQAFQPVRPAVAMVRGV